ncbi:hypothetical protein F4782DRAFT_549733 [Xylaria castorea]|nr:hypothetical protein F4782DRAFT_549733 [Xylaria castorea]
MSQPAPDSIVKAIAKFSPSHSIVEGMLTEYRKKPTLVHFTFWYGKSLAAPLSKGVETHTQNYETALAPSLANSTTKTLYESTQTQRSTYTESGRILSLCEIRDAAGKSIDYYFLENFHRTSVDSASEISARLRGFLTIPRGPGESQEADWWPNLVVRLSEASKAMECASKSIRTQELRIDSSEDFKRGTFTQFFGILASSRVRLQDYLVLINHKEEDERIIEEYNCLKKGKLMYNQELMEDIKSYNVAEKLPSDITFAHIKDFDKDQCEWAKRIEVYMAAWNTVPGLNPPRAFFVRWKTDEEKKEEGNELNERLHPLTRSGPDFCVPTTLEEEMRCQRVSGFTQRLDDYNRNLGDEKYGATLPTSS